MEMHAMMHRTTKTSDNARSLVNSEFVYSVIVATISDANGLKRISYKSIGPWFQRSVIFPRGANSLVMLATVINFLSEAIKM